MDVASLKVYYLCINIYMHFRAGLAAMDFYIVPSTARQEKAIDVRFIIIFGCKLQRNTYRSALIRDSSSASNLAISDELVPSHHRDLGVVFSHDLTWSAHYTTFSRIIFAA